MTNAIKVLVLNVQLKAIICTGHLLEYTFPSLENNVTVVPGKSHASDFTAASFGSELALGI